jgi:hypothetical protein
MSSSRRHSDAGTENTVDLRRIKCVVFDERGWPEGELLPLCAKLHADSK